MDTVEPHVVEQVIADRILLQISITLLFLLPYMTIGRGFNMYSCLIQFPQLTLLLFYIIEIQTQIMISAVVVGPSQEIRTGRQLSNKLMDKEEDANNSSPPITL